jgi:hypothetical protein
MAMTTAPNHLAGGPRRRGLVWVAGLIVALGAGVATAHGLYGVATAARVPTAIAWLYPLITDGLALVAYAATAQLSDRGRGYAWTVVVLAAGLSGTAQASYLAGGVHNATTTLRFGVGAWPAIAAAIVAHLLHLLDTTTRPTSAPALTPPGQPAAGTPPSREDGVPAPAGPGAGAAAGSPPAALPEGVPADAPPPGPSATDTPVALRTGASVPVRRTDQPQPDTATGQETPRYTDGEVLAALAGRTGPIGIRAAAREFGCGPGRARRLLTQAGLLEQSARTEDPGATDTAAPAGSPPHNRAAPRTSPVADAPTPGTSHADRTLHLIHGSPDPRTRQ